MLNNRVGIVFLNVPFSSRGLAFSVLDKNPDEFFLPRGFSGTLCLCSPQNRPRGLRESLSTRRVLGGLGFRGLGFKEKTACMDPHVREYHLRARGRAKSCYDL